LECEYKLLAGDTEFREIYQLLKGKDIGVDVLEHKDVNWIMGKGVFDGIVDRIARSYPK
jgi:hypothetical protein